MEKVFYEKPVVIMYDMTIEKGFATSTEPIGTNPEQDWE